MTKSAITPNQKVPAVVAWVYKLGPFAVGEGASGEGSLEFEVARLVERQIGFDDIADVKGNLSIAMMVRYVEHANGKLIASKYDLRRAERGFNAPLPESLVESFSRSRDRRMN